MKTRSMTMLFILVLWLAIGCGGREAPAPPELEQAVRVVRYMTSPMRLSRSGFQAQSSDKPSDFVSYMFSDMGVAEWPYSEEMVEEDPSLGEEARAIGMPLIPQGVSLVPRRPDPSQKTQLVVKSDDARKMIMVEGYADPSTKPVLTREWAFLP